MALDEKECAIIDRYDDKRRSQKDCSWFQKLDDLPCRGRPAGLSAFSIVRPSFAMSDRRLRALVVIESLNSPWRFQLQLCPFPYWTGLRDFTLAASRIFDSFSLGFANRRGRDNGASTSLRGKDDR